MEDKVFLKAILFSNLVTALIALGALIYAFKAKESADWAYSEASDASSYSSNASSYASDASDDISYIKRWGVECK
jgi:hypothetical protein